MSDPRDIATSLEPRAASEADAAEIARLSTQLGYPADVAQMRERLRALLRDERQLVRVIDTGERLLGWIAAEHRLNLESGESVEIIGLVVDEAAHRRGIGQHLVAAVLAWAGMRGQTRVVVRSNVARTQSHPFYERLGFVRHKTQHVYTYRR